ncbi:MAG: Fe(2+) transporter FeoB [Syntrophomonadaceae bacterium]|nr:Fe(2+) transporter FeoB [Bacillota bacterium]
MQNYEGSLVFHDLLAIPRADCAFTVALAGNPNTGKSTLFNALTGLKQHTGNWPGKTVVQHRGRYKHLNRDYILVDLPGTYSLLANSAEEQIARDFICFGRPHATVIVVDATCLERNLNLALQVMEITGRAVVSLNLIDEARRKKIVIDHLALENRLGVPVIPTAARFGEGLGQLKEAISLAAGRAIEPKPIQLPYPAEIEQLLEELVRQLPGSLPAWVNRRWVALRLLDGDRRVADWLRSISENDLPRRRIS